MSRVAFVGVCGLVFCWQIYALFVRQPGPTIGVPEANITVVEEFGAGATVDQTFTPEAAQLDGLTVWFVADAPGQVTVRCELAADEQQAFQPLYRWTEVVAVDGRTRRTFAFPPVARSYHRSMRFSLAATTPTQIGIEASRSDELRPGFLRIDGREQWGDLHFRTRSATRFRAFTAVARDLPQPLRDARVALVLLAIYNWATMTFVYFMVVTNEE